VLTRLESTLLDLRFHQRGQVPHSGRVVLAAVDEAAIAKFGRFPWDRRVLAHLIDRLDAEGAAAIGFDMSFSDEDLGAQFAGAKRFRKRFEELSLAAPTGRAAVERLGNADSDVAGAASALLALKSELKHGGEALYKVVKGRLEDGRQKLTDSRQQFDALVKEHAAYADELDHELTLRGGGCGTPPPSATVGSWNRVVGARRRNRPYLSFTPFPLLTMDAWTTSIACMASKRLTTIRIDPEDLRALSRARKDGVSSSELHPSWASPRCGKVLRKAAPSAHDVALFLGRHQAGG
jgi:hypothetical protein